MRKLTAILILLGASWFGLWVLHQSTRPRTPEPKVDGQIVSMEPSPDRSRIALVVRRKLPDKQRLNINAWRYNFVATLKNPHDWFGTDYGSDRYSVVLFDPKGRKVISKCPGGALLWSPDSQWLAVAAEPFLVISREGLKRKLPIGPLFSMVWRESKPYRLVYLSYRNQSILHEFNLDTGATSIRSRKLHMTDLYLVNNRPVVSYLSPGPGGDKSIVAAQLDSGRTLIKVPLYGYTDWDGGNLRISPDGRCFFFTTYASGSGLNVIAQVQHASSVLRRPLEAVLFQNTIMQTYQIQWPDYRPALRSKMYGNHCIVADQYDGRFLFMLDLNTGSRDPISISEAMTVAWWDRNMFLIADQCGMRLEGLVNPDPLPPPLLYHVVQGG